MPGESKMGSKRSSKKRLTDKRHSSGVRSTKRSFDKLTTSKKGAASAIRGRKKSKKKYSSTASNFFTNLKGEHKSRKSFSKLNLSNIKRLENLISQKKRLKRRKKLSRLSHSESIDVNSEVDHRLKNKRHDDRIYAEDEYYHQMAFKSPDGNRKLKKGGKHGSMKSIKKKTKNLFKSIKKADFSLNEVDRRDLINYFKNEYKNGFQKKVDFSQGDISTVSKNQIMNTTGNLKARIFGTGDSQSPEKQFFGHSKRQFASHSKVIRKPIIKQYDESSSNSEQDVESKIILQHPGIVNETSESSDYIDITTGAQGFDGDQGGLVNIEIKAGTERPMRTVSSIKYSELRAQNKRLEAEMKQLRDDFEENQRGLRSQGSMKRSLDLKNQELRNEISDLRTGYENFLLQKSDQVGEMEALIEVRIKIDSFPTKLSKKQFSQFSIFQFSDFFRS